MLNEIKKSFQLGGRTIDLSTGLIARQADGAVMVTCGGTAVLVTCVASKANVKNSFFPLTVNYTEKTYAAGKIPGGYFRREARPSEHETLVSRLIDRAIRPIFADGYSNEVQIIATVMSYDPEVPSDMLAFIGASAAVSLAGLPTNGTIAGVRVGMVDEQFIINPSYVELADSCLDLVVAGSSDAVIMVEAEAVEITEDEALKSVMHGFEAIQLAIKAIEELREQAGKPKVEWTASVKSTEEIALQGQVAELISADLKSAYQHKEKAARYAAIATVTEKAVAALAPEGSAVSASSVTEEVGNIGRAYVREQILKGHARIDGRDTKTVRPIDIRLGILPRVHGSALFTRGETQALVTATLGTERDAQKIDTLQGDTAEDFMFHYNFPPFSVGEVGFLGSPKRREIGHGRLAKRAILPVLPSNEDFPYVLRLVSEITACNGSSSMASVCGASLALMDAGVPTLAPVAGIAMGLIKEGDEYAVLTDILGDEDHLGDMDFKVAGTDQGITALQMDIKISGITREIMEQALAQAKEGRLHILGEMKKAITAPREDISSYAPRYTTIHVKESKIRDIIGKGGATIRELTESTNTTIEVSDDGTVKIAAVNKEDAERAIKRIEELTAEAEIGKIYDGQVVKIMDFGAIVTFLGGSCQGLVHISQISDEHVENVTDHVNENDAVRVKVIDIDRQGRVRLSLKEVQEQPAQSPEHVDQSAD
jgi:polyribonucleotide nucleotidyltransferase